VRYIIEFFEKIDTFSLFVQKNKKKHYILIKSIWIACFIQYLKGKYEIKQVKKKLPNSVETCKI